jgi:tetratricopeptide (TPR) repeat protein
MGSKKIKQERAPSSKRYPLRRKAKKRRFFRISVYLSISLLVTAALVSGWRIWRNKYLDAPRFNSILLSVNGEPRRVLSGESIHLHPKDRIKILRVSTNIPFNSGIRLVATDIDVTALEYTELRLATLLPNREMFGDYRFQIRIKYRNDDLGYVVWRVQPYAEDWLDKAGRTIKPEKRLDVLRQALHFLPEDRTIWRRLLDECEAQGRWQEASRMLEERAKKNQDPEILAELLKVYKAMNQKDGMISVLQRFVRLSPQDVGRRNMLAGLLEENGNWKAAINEYTAILKETDEAGRLSVYERLGFLYAKTGQAKKAISFYLKAVKLDQKDANLHYNLSQLYEQIHDEEKSDFYLANAVTLNAQDLENRLRLADRLMKRGDFKKAEKYLGEILKEKPNELEALVLMAQLMEKQGKKERLKAAYEKILTLDPENETVMYNLGALEYEAGNLKGSLPYFEKYIKKHPEDEGVHKILFDIYKKIKAPEMAFDQARILLDLDAKYLAPYDFVFEYLNARGEYKDIIPIMGKGIAANPEATELRKYQVYVYLKTGQEEQAAQQMEEILKRRPKDIDLWLQLARLREKRQEFPEALRAYKRIIEISPGHEEAGEAYLRLRLKGVEDADTR